MMPNAAETIREVTEDATRKAVFLEQLVEIDPTDKNAIETLQRKVREYLEKK